MNEPNTDSVPDLAKMPERRCPDDGRCWHACGESRCWRTQHCGPLSGVYPEDRWPAEVCLGKSLDQPRGPARCSDPYCGYPDTLNDGEGYHLEDDHGPYPYDRD